jgi:hypothetical protein
MRLLRLLLISSSLLLALPAARAQLLTADDFFNDGAHSYLSNNIPLALTNVETGLRFYPNDEKLQKLEKLLKQQQQQQSQQNQQNQNQQNQQNQSQKNQQQNSGQQNQQQNQQNSQSQNQDQQQQQKQNQQNQDQQNQQQKNAANENKTEQKSGETNGEEQAVAAGQMSPQEAKRLLDAQKGDEQILQMKPQGKPQDTSHPVKDW